MLSEAKNLLLWVPGSRFFGLCPQNDMWKLVSQLAKPQ
jgi:hypothetical protein